jgi:ABC-type molybdate transport system substrate-binding protein
MGHSRLGIKGGCRRERSHREDLMRRVRLLSVCAIIAGWLAVTSGSKAEDSKVLHVALAGTMEQVISRQIGPAFAAATGYTLDVTRQSSVLLANRIASGFRDAV